MLPTSNLIGIWSERTRVGPPIRPSGMQSRCDLKAAMSAAVAFIVSGRRSMVTSECFRINIDTLHVSRRR